MKNRNVILTLEKAKEWFNSGNVMLKDIALQAFSKKELEEFDFTEIKSFEDALLCVCESNSWKYDQFMGIADRLRNISKASAAMFKLNIIRQVLNSGLDLYLTKDPENTCIYYPYNPFVLESSTYYKSFGNAYIRGDAKVNGKADYIVFKNFWSSGRYFIWTRSNNRWAVGCFDGTGEELIKKAYRDSENSGREYERVVRYVESILADEEKEDRV